jgi:hypothetical protein
MTRIGDGLPQKIFTYARLWACDPQDSTPTYDKPEHFLRFLDKYVSHAISSHLFSQWSKSNCTKTFLDRVTASNIAYTILVYENCKEVWEEEWHIKKSISDDIQRKKVTCHKKPKYHEGRGKQLKRFSDGWTNVGWEYYQELLDTFKTLKSSDVWSTLQDHWKLNQKKYWNKVDEQDDNLSAQEEECEESDENDCKIDIGDGVGNYNIPEETASDDDDEGRPRNRLRIC